MPCRILVVDDERDVREVLSEYLIAAGFDVTALASGREALDLIGSGERVFDVALVDWHMPGISGRDVIEGLQEASPETAVIMTTGEVGTTLGGRWGRGNVEMIRKPFSLRSLARRIDELAEAAAHSKKSSLSWNADPP